MVPSGHLERRDGTVCDRGLGGHVACISPRSLLCKVSIAYHTCNNVGQGSCHYSTTPAKGPLALLSFLCLVLCISGCQNHFDQNVSDCLSCHRGIASAGKGHDFACRICHVLPQDRERALKDHSRIIRNPARLSSAQKICSPCHQNQVQNFQTSLHATLAGMINQTRFLFGAQASAFPPVFGAGGNLPLLPSAKAQIDRPADLVDDLLRRKCLGCHVEAAGSEHTPPYRSRGCAACHVIYASDGRYHGQDQAIDGGQSGYPKVHGLTADIPDSQCLKCHQPNYVGSDAHGLFERDYDSFFQEAMLGDRRAHEQTQGAVHSLAQDVHTRRGLQCVDCHSREDVMGDGRLAGFALDSPGTSCQECHGGFARSKPSSEVDGLHIESGKWFFDAKDGTRRQVPRFVADALSHNPRVHSRLRCSACHAQWTAHDYGLSLQRQDGGDFRVWTYLIRQGDPRLEAELEKLLADTDRTPTSRDLLTGKSGLGVWLKGYRFRRWENMVLGVDHQGRISLLRPLHQYRISYVDEQSRVLLDSVVPVRGDDQGPGWAYMPYVPHTTAKQGRPCQTCHGQTMAAGLGWSKDAGLTAGTDFELLRPSPPAIDSMRLLNADERRRLLDPQAGYGEKFFQTKKYISPAVGGTDIFFGSKGAKNGNLPETHPGPRIWKR